MAKYRGSPWGEISGKLGEVVGATSRGQRTARSMPGGYNDANTLVQRENRAKQIIKTQSLSAIKSFLKLIYNRLKGGNTYYSKAIQQYLNSALTFTGAVAEDTAQTLVPKSVLTGTDLLMGDNTIARPQIVTSSVWVDDTETNTIVVTDISGLENMPAAAKYRCFMLAKNGVGGFYSDTEIAVTQTSLPFVFESTIPAGKYITMIGLNYKDLSSYHIFAGEITIA